MLRTYPLVASKSASLPFAVLFLLYLYEIRRKSVRLHSQSPSITISPHFGQILILGDHIEFWKARLFIRSHIYNSSFLFIIFTKKSIFYIFYSKVNYFILFMYTKLYIVKELQILIKRFFQLYYSQALNFCLRHAISLVVFLLPPHPSLDPFHYLRIKTKAISPRCI